MKLRYLAILSILLTGMEPLSAHEANTTLSSVIVRQDQIKFTFSIAEAEMIDYFDLVMNDEVGYGRSVMLAKTDEVYSYLQEQTAFRVDGEPVVWAEHSSDTTIDRDGDLLLRLTLIAPLEELPAELDMRLDLAERLSSTHRNIAKILYAGKTMRQAVFSKDRSQQLFVFGEKKSVWDNVKAFTVLGVEHIFEGYDHILFLLALIVVGGRLMYLVKIVSAFTLAHSITLILAALEWVSLPGKLIEAGIALSIAYVAAENLWLRRADHRWILTFCFGLVHGFGFANVLRELGLPSKGLVASLLAFNVGVEIGQVVIVAVLFPLILWLARRAYQRQVVVGVSVVILLFGLGWFIDRVFELDFMPI